MRQKGGEKMREGTRMYACCYHEGCESPAVAVKLGRPYRIDPTFVAGGKVGKISWDPQKDKLEGFELAESFGGSGDYACGCDASRGAVFGGIVVITRTKGDPIAFGYEREGA